MPGGTTDGVRSAGRLLVLIIAAQGRLAAKDRFGGRARRRRERDVLLPNIINVGIDGTVALVGITLPLFSHGGSSVLTFMTASAC